MRFKNPFLFLRQYLIYEQPVTTRSISATSLNRGSYDHNNFQSGREYQEIFLLDIWNYAVLANSIHWFLIIIMPEDCISWRSFQLEDGAISFILYYFFFGCDGVLIQTKVLTKNFKTFRICLCMYVPIYSTLRHGQFYLVCLVFYLTKNVKFCFSLSHAPSQFNRLPPLIWIVMNNESEH